MTQSFNRFLCTKINYCLLHLPKKKIIISTQLSSVTQQWTAKLDESSGKIKTMINLYPKCPKMRSPIITHTWNIWISYIIFCYDFNAATCTASLRHAFVHAFNFFSYIQTWISWSLSLLVNSRAHLLFLCQFRRVGRHMASWDKHQKEEARWDRRRRFLCNTTTWALQ